MDNGAGAAAGAGPRVVMVTGASGGLGLAASRAFAAQGDTVLMACRDGERGRAAADDVRRAVPDAVIEVLRLDLADLGSVRACAAAAGERYPRIDVLCNNAGVLAPKQRRETRDGFEWQFGVNHLGHFALTGLLFGALTAASAARVVTVTSVVHRGMALHFEDLQGQQRYRPWLAYGRSKLANVLFAYELDRRARARGLPVASVACHPGVAKTNLMSRGSHDGAAAWWLRLGFVGSQTPQEGAASIVHAATADDVHGGDLIGPSGFLQTRGRLAAVSSSRASRDTAAARRLWTVSEELTGVRFLE